jgi:hypothetical protein
MPEFKLPTVTLPGLRDMTTDDIRHAIAEVPRPDVKMPDIELPKIDLAGAASSLAATAAEHNPMRPRRRSRRRIALFGMVAAGLALAAVANAAWIRARIEDTLSWIRDRMDAGRVSGSLEPMTGDEDAFTGSVGIPIESDTYADTLPPAGTTPGTALGDDLPTGVGSGIGSGHENGFDPERTGEGDRPYGG